MLELGYAISTEEHTPLALVRNARRAEEVGFTFALISDHFHPWINQQGQAPFVWTILGAIAHVTKTMQIGTGVTCPIIRYHPTLIAQAAATVAALMPGRFFLGLGTGEALNEHILGDHWPITSVRQEMLEESVQLIRQMWEGKEVSFWGEFYTVENARIYTLPDQLPPIYIAASGTASAELAGEIGDGFITTKPDADLIKTFEESGGKEKTKIGQMKVVWAKSESEALDTLYTHWPIETLPGALHSDLSTPAHFEAAAKLVKKEDMAGTMPLGPDPKRHIDQIQKVIDSGCDKVYIHQIGTDQEGFFNFYQKEIFPYFHIQPQK